MAAGAAFDVELDWSELDKLLDRQQEKVLQEIRGTMAVVAEMLVSAVSDRYETSGDGEWEPNKPSTIAKKKSSKPMIDKGRLSGSTNPFSGQDFAEASTDVAYIVYHLEGGPIIPKRNPFEVRDDALDEVEDFVLDRIAKAMGR